ncbi:hypothetical protein Mp_8g11080 [Marchantia polymorpha subsp. ruderalis]|uniref:Uncharacterized protein n=1 Tax=Marchantia polymorpha TaxID=3197 RepID=A0A2R6XMK1_MARPO|nr:hypothetical protein MARPO_0008s0112 [Marchantia polymorpha]BBN19487.1 hypothetical protein Mp_8g11080 [Marchantia polymorpha subsp. ruderalis]|eukprot:PTQ47341.1 hypothetical protein MARPO_0008s0112 [Marchantia polymorpha]
MGLIFVPYRHMHESLLKNSHRGSSESASTEQANTNENSYQSLQDLVRIYDDPSAIDATDRSANLDDDGEGEDDEARPSSSGASTSAASRTEGDSSSGDENARFYRALRRLHTSTPGPSSAANVVSSLIDTRTVRLLEVLSAYYVRAAYDRTRATAPPAAAVASSPGALSPVGLGILQGAAETAANSNIVTRPTTARVPERFTDSLARVYDAHRSLSMARASSQTAGVDPGDRDRGGGGGVRRRHQFILRPDHREVSPEELRLSHWQNGPFTFHNNVAIGVAADPSVTRRTAGPPAVVNPGPGLLRTPERSVDDLLHGPGPGLGLVQFRDGASSGGTVTVNPAFSSSSDSGPTQAYLRHNETRTNVTTHGCLRVIMRRHRGWEEQAARDNFVEYWHYSTIQRREAPGFEVVRDGIARLPWPLLALAGLHTLRSFAYQINSAHHRETPLPDYQGNVFDVVLVSPEPTSNPSEERAI